MARAYLKFKRTGTFTYRGGCSVDVDNPPDMKAIWAAANDYMFKEFLVKERDYSDEEWTFELVDVVMENETGTT